MMIAPIAAILSMNTVSAHTAEVSVDLTKVKGDFSTVFKITVKNTTGPAIDKVRLTIPSAWADEAEPAPVQLVPEDNIASINVSTENLVVLPKGTIVKLASTISVRLAENTEVVRLKDAKVYSPEVGKWYTLLENALVRVPEQTDTRDNFLANDNIELIEEKSLILENDNFVRLVEDTLVVLITGNEVKLPENTLVEVVEENEASGFVTNDNILVPENKTVTLAKADVVLVNDTSAKREGVETTTLSADTALHLGDGTENDNVVVILKSTRVQLTADVRVIIYENTVVTRPKDNRLLLITPAENRPVNWEQKDDSDWVEWDGILDNNIPKDENLEFPVALTSPGTSGIYTFYVRTTDVDGLTKEWTFDIEVDAMFERPEVSVSPYWVGENTEVTITITAEEVWTFENILVEENNAPENVNYTMENVQTTDNITYTLTYRTGDNRERDGFVTIYVLEAKDTFGNENSLVGAYAAGKELFVDRTDPIAPDLEALGIPGVPVGDPVTADMVENKSSFALSDTLTASDDNFWDNAYETNPPTVAGVEYTENFILQIIENVDNEINVITELRASPTGFLSYTLELPDGKHIVGARFVDHAGNVGEENFYQVIVDTAKPSVEVSIDPAPVEGYLAENEFTVTVTFRDLTLGIDNLVNEGLLENKELDNGYVVALCDEDGGLITVLNPKVPPTEDNVDNVRPGVFGVAQVYTFENFYDNAGRGLATGTYWIRAIAGDNMAIGFRKGAHQTEDNIKFTLDIVPPDAPDIAVTTYVGTTVDAPQKTRTKSWTLRGEAGAAEAGATIIIYGTTYDPITGAEIEADIELGRGTVKDDGSYSVTIALDAYEGKVVELELVAVDVAGNTSTRTLFGNFLYDATAPTVTIDPEDKEITTTEASVTISGSVSKDDWETFADLIVSVSPATAAMSFNPADGTFVVSVPLAEGTQIISVTAIDPVGNSSSDYSTITREKVVEVPPPYAEYAIVIVIIALILAAIAIFRKR
jgi:hypothetical protein